MGARRWKKEQSNVNQFPKKIINMNSLHYSVRQEDKPGSFALFIYRDGDRQGTRLCNLHDDGRDIARLGKYISDALNSCLDGTSMNVIPFPQNQTTDREKEKPSQEAAEFQPLCDELKAVNKHVEELIAQNDELTVERDAMRHQTADAKAALDCDPESSRTIAEEIGICIRDFTNERDALNQEIIAARDALGCKPRDNCNLADRIAELRKQGRIALQQTIRLRQKLQAEKKGQ
jgi:regulator of replication initiation timing